MTTVHVKSPGNDAAKLIAIRSLYGGQMNQLGGQNVFFGLFY
jgi:hypothetical protein